MKISAAWLNELLDPGNLSIQEIERLLTFAGFPIETIERLDSGPAAGDSCLDVEVTSNRGDVLCHVGVAREIAAATGRRLKLPAGFTASAAAAQGAPRSDANPRFMLENHVAAVNQGGFPVCAHFSARLIRGVKVGPSPAWLVKKLAAVGQRSINNVVDVTNIVCLELGQPTHVFDFAKFKADSAGKARVVVGIAGKGEKLALLDGKTVTLSGDEVVVIDGNLPSAVGAPLGTAVSLAGVMGGATTQVTDQTTDVLLESATWSPAAVRRAARRFNIRSDASYRFERIVDLRTIEAAADRACDLILQLAGGSLEPGVAITGAPPQPSRVIEFRPSRCELVLGQSVALEEIRRIFAALDIKVEAQTFAGASGLGCMIPPHRPDLEREIDLIEEVARLHGLDKLHIRQRESVVVRQPQLSERATRELCSILTGLGYHEAVTFTFVSRAAAKPFTPKGLEVVEVQDERRKADPVLRPSALISLLNCRRANQDSGGDREYLEHAGLAAGTVDSGVRLFEIASAFAQHPPESKGDKPISVESVNIALIADVGFPAGAKSFEQRQSAIRMMRSTLEHLARGLGGAAAEIELEPVQADRSAQAFVAAFDADSSAAVYLAARNQRIHLGTLGLLAQSLQSQLGLEKPVVMAEVSLAPLIALYPPRALVHELPAFPSIERDLSLIVREEITWRQISDLVAAAKVERLEHTSFVTTYRGPQAGPGKKSVTLRLRFRDPAKTLRHEEVDGPVNALVEKAKKELNAELRVV